MLQLFEIRGMNLQVSYGDGGVRGNQQGVPDLSSVCRDILLFSMLWVHMQIRCNTIKTATD